MLYSDRQIDEWATKTANFGLLDEEIERIKSLMVFRTKNPLSDMESNRAIVLQYNRMFKALLSEKSRQELIEKVSDNDCSSPKDSCASPTDDTPRSVGVWNVLKQQAPWR
jgi:hypothetical protein